PGLFRRRIMQQRLMSEKPSNFPAMQPDGEPLKPITQVLLDRRATKSFKPDEVVPDEYLDAILSFGAQAPSGYNLQPWRFIVVRDEENRRRLRRAAMNQAKVAEAPVVIIAVGVKSDLEQRADQVLREGARRGAGKFEEVEGAKRGAMKFLSTIPLDVWLNRHTMIAVTTMMLVAESYGFDTAPMEGFDPAAVKREFGVPEEDEVVALLAIGRAQETDKPYPGRFPLEQIVFSERYGAA
ncbi:MAG TPA: nitroreductase family protein, partial [Blastocatellia bacterium]|nr:nitroreductase family protein [Blastocatellia bacterium]